jgi:glycosyltransferase involved in cell wall biosynthesis
MKDSVSKQPLVSIHLGCYNHSKYVVDALESIKAQTYKNYQVYIWDDCSQDNSREIIKEWIEKNRFPCTFVANTENLGLCRSLNQALAAAQGKYIAGFSADDIWMPEKIEKQVAFFESLPEQTGVIYSNALTMNADGTLRPETTVDWYKNSHPVPPEGKVFKEILKYNFVTAPTVMIPRAVFERVGIYDDSLPHEDFDMFLRIAEHFEFRYMPECLVKYRVTPGALNTKQDLIQPAKFRILERYLKRRDLGVAEQGAVIGIMALTAMNMYRLGLPVAAKALSKISRFKNDRRLLWAAKASSFGVPYQPFNLGYRQLSRLSALVSFLKSLLYKY